jgi:gluconate 2-dehydrogenase subunit 3-like protein
MKNEKKAGSVNRRDLLKVMGAAPAALVPIGALSAATPAKQAYEPKLFNAHDWKTLRVLSDLIIPADERSGSATQADVPEVIDDWLNVHGKPSATEIIGGMRWLDMQCNRIDGRDFVDCTVDQQKQMLDRIAYPKKAAPEDSQAVAFFNHLRDLVVGSFYSSKIGVKDIAYVGNRMVPEWNGCPEAVISKLGVSYLS